MALKIRVKNAFLKNLERLPAKHRQRIEQLVLTEVAQLDSFQQIKNVRKIRSEKNFYRIRVGDYHIGFEVRNSEIVFLRKDFPRKQDVDCSN